MKTRNFRSAGRLLAGLGLLAALGACASGPHVRALKAEGASEPIAVIAVVVPDEDQRMNQWGGVIPEARPTTPVEDGGLDEISS